jgi:hypothetical protein
VAEELAHALWVSGFDAWLDTRDLISGEPMRRQLQDALRKSEFLVVLVSKNSSDSDWAAWELSEALRPQQRARQMEVIPVRIDDAEPPRDLASMLAVPLLDSNGKVGRPLIQVLNRLLATDPASLDPSRLELLVAELLPRLGFDSVARATRAMDREFDFIARLLLPDPFGTVREEQWMIEVKHHLVSRVSTAALAELAGRMMFLPSSRRGVIITTSTLTSAAREFLDRANRERSLELRVVEGDELRRLVARFPDLVATYFPAANAAE